MMCFDQFISSGTVYSTDNDRRLAYHQQHTQLLAEIKAGIEFGKKVPEPNSQLAQYVSMEVGEEHTPSKFMLAPSAPVNDQVQHKSALVMTHSLHATTVHDQAKMHVVHGAGMIVSTAHLWSVALK